MSQELVAQAGRLADDGKPDEAMDIVNELLLDEPDNVGAIYVAGCVLLQAARHVQAMQMCKRVIELHPRDPRGYGLMALCYGELHKYDESIRFAQKALDLRRDAKTLADAAYAYANSGDWDVADRFSLDAIELAKGKDDGVSKEALRDALIHQAYVRLAKKDWKSGFEGFRRTLRTKWRKEWAYGDSKEWMGEEDAVLMVTGEQGLGDEIMAASVVPDACDTVKTFILDCDHRLAPLFKRAFPKAMVSPTRREQTVTLPVMPTHHKSLFGLAEVLRQADWDFHREPYLFPRDDYVRMFKSLIGSEATGLAWSGGLPRTGREQRNAGLFSMLPLLKKGGTFVSLEYKDDAAEVAEMERRHGIKIIRLPWATQSPDMDLLAGLLAACAHVFGVHTSALHLSSAMGVPTTILTHRGSGWRYGPHELLWYPKTTKTVKKRPGESWRELVERCS